MIGKVLLIATLAALVSCSQEPKVLDSAPTGNWISLFNGKNLDDWTVKIARQELNDNYRNTLRVEDGLLKVSYQQYAKFGDRFGSLFYKRKFSHYWIRAEYRFVGSLAPGAPRWAPTQGLAYGLCGPFSNGQFTGDTCFVMPKCAHSEAM